MAGWKGTVGQSFTPETFDAYCHALQWTAWRPTFIVLHNTATPSLAQRPNGFSNQHILNLERYYRDTQGWKATVTREVQRFLVARYGGDHAPGAGGRP